MHVCLFVVVSLPLQAGMVRLRYCMSLDDWPGLAQPAALACTLYACSSCWPGLLLCVVFWSSSP